MAHTNLFLFWVRPMLIPKVVPMKVKVRGANPNDSLLVSSEENLARLEEESFSVRYLEIIWRKLT